MSDGLTIEQRALIAFGFLAAAAAVALAVWHIGLWLENRRRERNHKEVTHG